MFRKQFVILFAILLLSTISKAQQQNGSVFETRVTISQKNQSINSILDQISWQAGVYFSYDASILNSNQKYSIEVNDKSLYTVLNQLLDPSEFIFTELENQIIISKNTADKISEEAKVDSIPVKYFFLSGKIIDNKKGDPIKYASISLLNKPIGTITNVDGNFILKIHPDFIRDTLVFSCMGYVQLLIPAYKILDEDVIVMNPFSIRIKEVKVVATTPGKLLENIRENLAVNYSGDSKLMTAFYRETIKQDDEYINVSEAVIEILKAPYNNSNRSDLVRIIKGRRSSDVKQFQWLNFKLQGGPFTITRLDIVKTVETFFDQNYQSLYDYNISKVIWYNENPVYVLEFKPIGNFNENGFVGEMYVHRETFAIVHVSFHYTKTGLKNAENEMIKKKPKGVKAKPTYTNYEANYQLYKGKWHLANVKASVKFKVRSRNDKLNSEYHSVSDLLITDIQDTELKKFDRDESFTQRDIFVEMINNYDPGFWENFNIIKPDEDLQNAYKNADIK
ncbi:MAG TPA: STN and carboxypeptidase regulatory-like domain-containing protein [Draconibacterium sp.]|nr:STN and carboxypeptidase regulatory-like domain-containing protein [Draconibacterium sp.]